MAIGQCGSVLGSHLFPKKEGPTYVYAQIVGVGKSDLKFYNSRKGFGVSCALLCLSALSSVVLSVNNCFLVVILLYFIDILSRCLIKWKMQSEIEFMGTPRPIPELTRMIWRTRFVSLLLPDGLPLHIPFRLPISDMFHNAVFGTLTRAVALLQHQQ